MVTGSLIKKTDMSQHRLTALLVKVARVLACMTVFCWCVFLIFRILQVLFHWRNEPSPFGITIVLTILICFGAFLFLEIIYGIRTGRTRFVSISNVFMAAGIVALCWCGFRGVMLARETEPRYVIGLFAGFVAVGIGLILVILERKEKRSPIRVDVNSRR
jgi:hypothetical protein